MTNVFFLNDPSTTDIYTLSLHDALPISNLKPARSTSIAQPFDRSHNPNADTHSQVPTPDRSEEHTSELQSHSDLVCRLLLEKKKKRICMRHTPDERSLSWKIMIVIRPRR